MGVITEPELDKRDGKMERKSEMRQTECERERGGVLDGAAL